MDINQTKEIKYLLQEYKPRAVIHFAAESHVDRSINKPSNFIETNVAGTFSLLEASKDYFFQLDDKQKALFKFINVSTDEVYGSLHKMMHHSQSNLASIQAAHTAQAKRVLI